MSRRSPLTTLLRVRRLQQDIASAEVARVRAAAELAERLAAEREDAVARSRPRDGDPRTFVASLVAGRALAADAFAARRAAGRADQVVQQQLDAWARASSHAEGVQRVVDRHEQEADAADQRKDAAERDDLAAGAWQRRRGDQHDRREEEL